MSVGNETGALDRMIVREDVLQICYWYQGEGFGDRFDGLVSASIVIEGYGATYGLRVPRQTARQRLQQLVDSFPSLS